MRTESRCLGKACFRRIDEASWLGTGLTNSGIGEQLAEMDGKILILEDDQAFAEMLVENLEANDLKAEVSLDPSRAIDRVREENFDILVSDYLMPKLEGTAFIRKIREFNHSIPVIMISAYMGDAEIRQAAKVGVTRILKKPFQVSELILELEKVLGEKKSLANGETRKRRSGSSDVTYPEPLQHLSAESHESRRWVQSLWEAFESKEPIFVAGDRGFEVDPIVSELAQWQDPDGGKIAFDFDAAELLGSKARSLLARFSGKDRYSRVVIGRGLDQLDRSQQRMLSELLVRRDSYLRQDGELTILFPVNSERLSLAEMSMDEKLLEMVFSNLVRVPPLRGRFREIFHYMRHSLSDGKTPDLNFSPDAAALMLRYDWPGNFYELIEVRNRLAKRWGGGELSVEQVRSAMEKRLTSPLDELPESALSEVLRERQNEVLENLMQAERKSPVEVLRSVGCPETTPARQFPSGQELLYPGLLDSVDEA